MSNEPDKVNSGALATMIVLVALTTFAVALVVTALVRQETTRLHAQGDQNQERQFRQLRSEQESKLISAPAWVDQEAGLASVSINSAMQIVLEDVRENPLALSPGNKPPDEEEGALEGETENSEAEAATEGSEDGEEEVVAAEETSVPNTPAPTLAPKTVPEATSPKTPAPKSPAPAAPKSPAPAAPKAPAPVPSPAPSSTPTPQGPAQ